MIQNYLSEMKMRFWLTSLGLFFSGILMSLLIILNNNASFSILPVDHSDSLISKQQGGKLLKNDTLKAVFTAPEDNLGIIAIRLRNYNAWDINEDTVIFRIKEKSSPTWYYEQAYSGGNFRTLSLYPFGFPKIADSKNKQYIVELTSKTGTQTNALTFDTRRPFFVGNYQFSQKILFSNISIFFHFIKEKVEFSLTDTVILFIIFCAFVPFFLYLFLKDFLEKKMDRVSQFFAGNEKGKKDSKWKIYFTNIHTITTLGILLFIILIYVLFFSSDSPHFLGYTLFLWSFGIWYHKLPSTVSFIFSILFLLLCSCALIIYMPPVAEKTAIWSFLFLLVGTVQALFELYKEENNSI